MEKPYARYHMREDQISRLEVQKCSTVKQTPPNELRNINFTLGRRAFSKTQPPHSLKNIGGMTLYELKHNQNCSNFTYFFDGPRINHQTVVIFCKIGVRCKSPSAVTYNRKSIFWRAAGHRVL